MFRNYDILKTEWMLRALHNKLREATITDIPTVRPHGIHPTICYLGDIPVSSKRNTDPTLGVFKESVTKRNPTWLIAWDLAGCEWRLNIMGEMIVHWVMLNNEFVGGRRALDEDYINWNIQEGKTRHAVSYGHLADALIVAECIARVDWEPFKVSSAK